MIDADDTPLLTLLYPKALIGAGESHHVARRVIGGERLLRVSVAIGRQLLGIENQSMDRAIADEPVADMAVASARPG